MGFPGIGSRPLSVRHPGLSQQTSVPVVPGWQTHAQRMWLLYGFDPKWADAFRDEAHYREAWARNREELMQECPPVSKANRSAGAVHITVSTAKTMVLLEGGFLARR